MNKTIKEQLNSCGIANIPAFDDNTTSIIISRGGSNAIEVSLNSEYLIEISDYILQNPRICNDRIQSKYLQCVITQFNGTMIKMDAIGYDCESNSTKNDIYLGLWIDKSQFDIIKKL